MTDLAALQKTYRAARDTYLYAVRCGVVTAAQGDAAYFAARDYNAALLKQEAQSEVT